jgi:streptogramin lyase
VFGADAVWLADGSDRTVTRIEPATGQTTAFDVPARPQYVTVDQGSGEVWALSVPEA